MMTEQQKQVLLAGLIFAVLLLFLVGYFYFISVRPAIAKNEAEIKKATTELATKRTELQSINRLLENDDLLADLMETVEASKKRLPETDEPLEFLRLLRESLQRTGASQSKVARANKVDRALYTEIPYNVTGLARFHEFGQFINLVECNPERFMRVSTFTLANNQNRPSIHPMTIAITTFIFTGPTNPIAESTAARSSTR